MSIDRKKYYSAKKVNEIIDLLKNNTTDKVFFNINLDRNFLFEGIIKENKFRIQKVLPSRYVLKPNIFGTLEQNNENTQIEIIIRPRFRTFLFLSFLLVFILIFGYLVIFEIKQNTLMYFFALMVIFLFFISYYLYRQQIKEIINDFEKTLNL